MTQKDEDLLLKDISTRLPYGVILHDEYRNKDYKLKSLDANWYINYDHANSITHIKPYLRPMSSMTEEEKGHCDYLILHMEDWLSYYDYLNSRYLDYRGLIEMGLALEAPEGMYN